ncbi:MAG: monovalent cation:proton antiporter-2 (CPA2) family protein [Bacteroidales bacterium]
MEQSFFLQAIIYLGAAVVCVPLMKRLGMSSVIGYLAAGILIGPFVLGFVGAEGKDIMHFGEFGVVMMLFLIGLELEPQRLWKMRKLIVGLGTLQMVFTAGIFFLIGHFALGLTWQSATAISLALAMSSTAMVMQTLHEKGLVKTKAGRYSFLLLLFQDIALVPVLAIIPLLSVIKHAEPVGAAIPLINQLPGILQPIAVILFMTLNFTFGKYILIPLLRVVTRTRLRELFAASALLIVVGISYIMQLIGLSPALGAFIGGMILANSEFKHELDSTLSPFKGLLLGLFFIAVGASINFRVIINEPLTVTSLLFAIIIIKGLILFFTGWIHHVKTRSNLIFTFGLSQVGEFAFILLAFTGQLKVITPHMLDILMAVTALSMTISPLLILANEQLILPRFSNSRRHHHEEVVIEEKNRVIIAGFSHFGSMMGRFLKAHGVKATILDYDPDRVELLRKVGFKVYYGDATRVDLLEAAGANDAEIFVSTISDLETNRKLIYSVKKHFPHMKLMVRSKGRPDTYELIDLGVDHIYRDYVDTSIRMGADVLKELGFKPFAVNRAARKFFRYDEEALYDLASHRHDLKRYIDKVKQEIQLQEELIMNDMQYLPDKEDLLRDCEQPTGLLLGGQEDPHPETEK